MVAWNGLVARVRRWPGPAAFGAGALTVTGFAPFHLFALPPFTLALLFLLWRDAAPRDALRIGALFGLGLMGFGVFWLHISIDQFGNVGTPLAILITLGFVLGIASFFGLAGWLGRRLGAGPVAEPLVVLPAAWILLEWVRGWLFTGFPWLSIGYSQTAAPLAGFAPLVGVYGVGWLLALSAGALAVCAVRRDLWPLWLALLVALWGGGALLRPVSWTAPAGPAVRVALVQGNIPQELKWRPEVRQLTLELYLRLTRGHWDSDLIVWPETAVPDFLQRVRDSVLEPLAAEAGSHGAALLVGIPSLDLETDRYYNAAVVPGTDQVYYKRHLVPFGEFLPFKPWLGPLLDWLEIPMSDFSPGTAARPLVRVGDWPVGVSICYEDAFGDEVMQALPDAQILVNMSNDAWFGDSLAPHQHQQIARMRALEAGRPMLRATNTGISAAIGPDGRIIAASALFQEAVVTAAVTPMLGSTPYARVGNGPIVGFLVLLLGGVVLAGRLLRR